MKVKELIEKLEMLNQDTEVVISSDGDGNSFSPVTDLKTCKYLSFTMYDGSIYLLDEAKCEGVDAVCLWPANLT